MQKKVRDVKFCRETARVATVSADGTLMVLDAQLGLIRTVRWCSNVHLSRGIVVWAPRRVLLLEISGTINGKG